MTDAVDPTDAASASVSTVTTGEIGIDITKQKVGTIIMVETEDNHLFEMEVTVPEKGVVKVSGTEPRLKFSALGVLAHSSSGKTQINYWIGKLLEMSLIFRNGNYESKPVIHVSVKGVGWQYEVF